jgi:hypothetical protein
MVDARLYDNDGQIVKRERQTPNEYTTHPAIIQAELFREALLETENDRKLFREEIK